MNVRSYKSMDFLVMLRAAPKTEFKPRTSSNPDTKNASKSLVAHALLTCTCQRADTRKSVTGPTPFKMIFPWCTDCRTVVGPK
eukprot:4554021-Amphidinium_carterae.1